MPYQHAEVDLFDQKLTISIKVVGRSAQRILRTPVGVDVAGAGLCPIKIAPHSSLHPKVHYAQEAIIGLRRNVNV